MGHRVSFLVASLGFAVATSGCAPATAPSSALLERSPALLGRSATRGSALPPIALTTLAGDKAELATLAHGRVALVSLWATWCEACEREMDALNRLDARTGTDAVVIGVAVGEERDHVAAFVRQRGLRYAQLVDPDFVFADAVGQRRLPATLVVDRSGRIVFRGEALDVAGLEALKRAVAAAD